MVAYPVEIVVKPYGGQDSKKLAAYHRRLAIALGIQDYLNDKMEPLKAGDIGEFNYGEIAADLGMDKKIVRDILYPVDCGSNGITIGK